MVTRFYVDDIIFGPTKYDLAQQFAATMQSEF